MAFLGIPSGARCSMVLVAGGAGGAADCWRLIVLGGQGRRDTSCCAIFSRRLRCGAAVGLALLAATLVCGPAQAESLEQALADAYLVNPVLNAERARLRAIDEQVALAKAGLRPNIGGTADTNYVNQNSDRRGLGALDFGAGGLTTDGVTHPRGYALQLS